MPSSGIMASHSGRSRRPKGKAPFSVDFPRCRDQREEFTEKGVFAVSGCLICGRPVKKKKNKFCSRECYSKWRSENFSGENSPNWKDTRTEHTCETCSERFSAYPSRHRRFCSRVCYSEWRRCQPKESHPRWKGGKAESHCMTCNAVIYVWPSRLAKATTVFCSLGCRSIWYSENFSGEDSPQWIDGKSLEPYPPDFNYALKQAVRKRDVICRLCGKSEQGGTHSIHHINYRKEDLHEKNLVLLCRSCHTATNHNRSHWQRILTDLMEGKTDEIPTQPKLL